jgi:hypothetical protein
VGCSREPPANLFSCGSGFVSSAPSAGFHTMQKRLPSRAWGHSTFRGVRRFCFVLARRSFISRIFRFNARGRGERRRRSFSFSAIRRLLASAALCSNSSINRRTAIARFWCWERESLTVTDNPVGTCRKVTAVDTLLTFWPPGPPDRAKNSANCDSLNPSR